MNAMDMECTLRGYCIILPKISKISLEKTLYMWLIKDINIAIYYANALGIFIVTFLHICVCTCICSTLQL